MRPLPAWLIAFTVLPLGCDAAFQVAPASAPEPPPYSAPPVLPRLTSQQYRNALKDVFGSALPPTVVEPDTNPYLFYSIGATTTTLSELGTEQYAQAAAAVTDAIFGDGARRDLLLSCTPASAGDACTADFIRRIGLKLFRRPLGADDVARWLSVAKSTADGDAYRGIRLALYGMLQSPNFVYRVELGEPIPGETRTPERRRYTSYEMAERLSFLLWNTTPDDELLSAAGRGELLDPASLHFQTLRLLDSPRARLAVQSFFDQYFDLAGLAQVERDPARYPAWSKTLGPSMRTEVQLLVDDFVFRRDSDIRELYSTRRTFVNQELAALYGVTAAGASAVAFVPVELPESGPRAGVLTLGAFLTMNAHPTETSPTRRGKYVRERVLCLPVPPPPGNVNLNLDDKMDAGPRTLRQRLEEHRKNPSCAGCHALMDPPGFLFEKFDSIGVYRTVVDGLPVDTASDIDGVPYSDARDLGKRLAADPLVPQCIVKQLYRHANARLDESGDDKALRDLGEQFAQNGYRFRDLLVALVSSDAFRTVAPAEVMP